MLKIIAYLIILLLFYKLIIEPGASGDTVEASYGVIHGPSFWFIFLSAFFLHLAARGSIHRFKWQLSHAKRKRPDEGVMDEAIEKLDQIVIFGRQQPELYKKLKEAEINNPVIQAISEGIRLGAIEEDIDHRVQRVVEDEAYLIRARYQHANYMAGYLPMLGMVGTIAGLMLMFSQPGQMEDFAEKFSGLAIALLTTLYSALLTILIYKPLQHHHTNQQAHLDHQYEVVISRARVLYHQIDILIYQHFWHSGDENMLPHPEEAEEQDKVDENNEDQPYEAEPVHA